MSDHRVPWFPHPAFIRGILLRAAVIWLGVRFMLSFSELLVPTVAAAYAIVALAAGLALWDGHRSSEVVFVANLGVPAWRIFALATIPPASAELLIQIVASWTGTPS